MLKVLIADDHAIVRKGLREILREAAENTQVGEASNGQEALAQVEARHWDVVEQDRVILEVMELDANKREHLYQHDVAVTRLRRMLRQLAIEQLTGKN